MEHFVVSARKYRPQTFEDVVGQQAITNTLENAIANNHLAQALLFCGPRGVGKTSCARILAKRINTDKHTSPDEDFAFNVFELDAASNNSVDDIRSLIDQVRIPPQVGKYKVYIIDEVHMLSASAFNAFLKTLEEPPKHAIFILATTEKHKIIPTILSRCQIFDFKRITVTDARKHLEKIAAHQGITAEEEALHIIAQKADGAMRDALSIFDRVISFSGTTLTRKAVTQNLNVLDYDTYFETTDLILANNIPDLLLRYNEILSQGFDGHHFIAGLANHFRDLMVCKNPATLALLEVGERAKQQYGAQAQKVTPGFLLTAIDMANDCDIKYRTSRNQRLLVELCLMQLASITYDGEKKKQQPVIIPPPEAKAIAQAQKRAAIFEEQTEAIAQQQPKAQQESNVSEAQGTPTPVPNSNIVLESSPSRPEVENIQAVVATGHKEHTITAAIPAPAQPDSSTQSDLPQTEEKKKTLSQQASITQAQAPATTPLVTPKINIKRENSVSGLSLKSLQKKKEILKQKSEKEVDVSNLPKEPFTEEAMIAAWNEYVALLDKKGEKIMASNLQTDIPRLQGTTISIEFPNDTMRVELERAQGSLLEFLKRTLNNYDITLTIEVNEVTKRVYAYTAPEKYERMKEQNPAIEILKNTFDLEL